MDSKKDLPNEDLIKQVERIYADFEQQVVKIQKARDEKIMQILSRAELKHTSALRKKIFDMTDAQNKS